MVVAWSLVHDFAMLLLDDRLKQLIAKWPLRGRCAARPDRSPFLADEAPALRGQAIGDGAVFQERYFRPPELIPGGSGKYGR